MCWAPVGCVASRTPGKALATAAATTASGIACAPPMRILSSTPIARVAGHLGWARYTMAAVMPAETAPWLVVGVVSVAIPPIPAPM